MACHLIGLDNQTGVLLVEIGETQHHCMEKCVLMVSRAEAKESCVTEQLCGNIEVGIEGGIHATKWLLQQHSQEEY